MLLVATILSGWRMPTSHASANSPARTAFVVGNRGRVDATPARGIAVRAAPLPLDSEYPGTAVQRLQNVHERVRGLALEDLSGTWEDVRRRILWAGGLRDLPGAAPGQGYTGHSFNDDNHCDLTTMLGNVAHNEHTGGINAIALGNQLGPGIAVASIPELGPGGSWSTCTNGCHLDPPQDVAHVQFLSRIAFKLVWCPPEFKSFVLVDDEGQYLKHGTPTGELPPLRLRQSNYRLVQGSKYAREAEGLATR